LRVGCHCFATAGDVVASDCPDSGGRGMLMLVMCAAGSVCAVFSALETVPVVVPLPPGVAARTNAQFLGTVSLVRPITARANRAMTRGSGVARTATLIEAMP